MPDFDFNPTADHIRLVTNLGKTSVLIRKQVPSLGVDPTLNPDSLSVAGAAYTNSFSGSTATTLYS
ncbi:MAG: DUF4394 domain-containing protein [Chitinophagaceae bacterium]|nr:DUF4394 domain-containing protein [Chitinophagaceae bacterium]